jgi:hypothetical protein
MMAFNKAEICSTFQQLKYHINIVTNFSLLFIYLLKNVTAYFWALIEPSDTVMEN